MKYNESTFLYRSAYIVWASWMLYQLFPSYDIYDNIRHGFVLERTNVFSHAHHQQTIQELWSILIPDMVQQIITKRGILMKSSLNCQQ